MITEKTNVWRSGLSSLAKGLARVLPGSGPKKQSGSNGAFLAVFSAFATLSLLFTPNTTLAQDDEGPAALTVSFGADSYTAIENGARAMVMISLDEPADRALSIPLNTSPATGPFTVAFTSVDFAVGEQHRTIAVTATDDKDLDSETVTLSLGTRPAGVSLGSPSSAKVTLWDDDLKALKISFGGTSAIAKENGGNATVAVTLNAATDRALRVPITTHLDSNGPTDPTNNAAEAADFKLSATEVVFNKGQTRKTFTVSAEDDDDLVDNFLALGFGTLPDGVTVSDADGAATTTTVTLDDDGMRIVEFDANKYSATEGGSATTVTVNVAPVPLSDVTIRISVSPAPASNNPDYSIGTNLSGTGSTRSLTVGTSGSNTFDVTALADTDSVSEKITFRIVSPLPPTVRLGKDSSTVVTLTDSAAPPTPQVYFGASAQTPISEGSSRTVAVTLNPTSDEEVKVDVAPTIAGDNSANADYKLNDKAPATTTLTFAPGEGRKTVTIKSEADADTTDETVTLTLENLDSDDSDAAIDTERNTTTITINDDTKITATIAAAANFINEGTIGNTVGVTVTLSAVAPANGVIIPITVSPSSGDFTLPAATGTGFTTANRRVTIASGQTTGTFTVTAKEDDENTTDQDVTFGFGGLPSNVKAGKPNTAKVTVRDANRPILSFGAAAYTAIENGDAATVEITLSRVAGRKVTVPITATAAQGAAATDWLLSATEVVFSATEQRKTITVAAAADTDVNPEAVTLGFGTYTPADPVVTTTGGQNTTTVTLADDGQRVVIFGSADGTTAPANLKLAEGATGNVTVTMIPAPAAAMEIPITVSPASGDNFSLPSSFKNKLEIPTGGSATIAVDAKADDNDVNDKVTFSFGALPVNLRAGSPSTGVVTLQEPGAGDPVVSFDAPTYTVIENGADVTVTITLEPAASKKVTVPVTVAGTDSADTAAFSTSIKNDKVIFEKGETRKTITVTAKSDADNTNENITLNIGTPTPANANVTTTGGLAIATVNIVDDGVTKKTVSFSANQSVVEGTAATVTVTISEAPGTGNTLTIPITATPATGDYILSPPRRVVFTGDAQTTADIVVTTTADTKIEETDVKVKLGFGALPSDYAAATNVTSEVTFTDDDREAYQVDYNTDTYGVAEGKTVKVRVNLTLADGSGVPAKGADRGFTVPITFDDSTNTGGGTADKDDYSLSAKQVVFKKGDKNKTITFTANENTDAQADETVLLGFGPANKMPAGVAIGTTTNITTVTIADSHAVLAVNFVAGSYAAIEGGTDAVIKLTVDPAVDRDLMIPINTNLDKGFTLEGVTGKGKKYQLALAKKDTSALITVKAAADANVDDEMLTLSFGNAAAGMPEGVTAGGTVATVNVTLVDNKQTKSTVSFGAATYEAMEDGDAAMVMVKLDPPVPSGSRNTVKIPVSGLPMTGAVASNFKLSAKEVTFAAGEMSKTITVEAVDDNVAKTVNGTVKVMFGELPEGITAGATKETTVTLVDDDRNDLKVVFAAETYMATEGGDAATVAVMLDKATNREVTIPITTDPADGPFTVTPTNVVFAAGEMRKNVTVTAELDDDVADAMVSLAIGSPLPLGVTAGEQATTAVTLTDDKLKALTVSFDKAAYKAYEAGAGGPETVTVMVMLNEASDRALTIPITAEPSRTSEDSDFEISAMEVAFAKGDKSKEITVTAAVDRDQFDDSVTLGFGDLPVHVAEAEDNAEAEVTLVDSKLIPLTVSFDKAAYTADEGGAATTVTVNLNEAADREVTVSITADPKSGSFTLSANEVTFAEGDESMEITVTSDLDDDTEDQTVKLTLGDFPDLVSAGANGSATVTLADDGLLPLVVSFDAGEYTANEGGDDATVMVSLSAASDRAVTVPINIDPATGDFEISAMEVMFAAGDMSKEITVKATLDDDIEDEMVTLSLGALPDRVTAGQATTAVTLKDDGLIPLVVSFDAGEYTATEGGAAATVMVSLSEASDRDVTIPITTDPAEGDFELSANEVMFAKGDMSKEITVTATSDDDVDDEMVTLGLGDLPKRVTAGDQATTVVSLVDKGYTVTFAQARQTVRESERGTVTANISPAANGQVSIPLSVTHQGGATAADYSGVPGSLAFSGGSSQASFTVAVMADEENDPGESIDVSFGTLPDKVNAGDLTMTTVEFEQFRTPEQFSRTLQAALAVVAGAMGDSAVNAIESRFERYRESMGNGVSAGLLDSERTYGHWSDMESPGLAMTGQHGASGMDHGFVPMATTTPGTGLNAGSTGYGRSHTSGSLEEAISLGALTSTARPGESVIASGYGMAPTEGQEVNFSGVAFEMAMDHGDEGKFSPVVWVQGDLQRFDGEIEDIGMDFDGGLDAIHLGVDLYANGQTLAGVSLMQSWGDLDYTDDGVDGSLDSSMTTFHPYVYFQANQNLGVWGILGFGSGSVDVSEPDRTHEFDADFSMFAGGVRSVLNRRDNNELGLSADAFMAELSTDAADDISGVSGEAQRARVMVDWLSNSTMDAGQDFSWKAEIGGRFDGGDGIEGAGIEAGFRAGLVDSDQGLDVALGARALLLHENDASDYGIGVQVTWDPGEKRKGMVASLGSSYGQDRGGSTSLWDNGNAMNPIGSMWQETQVRVDGEVGYAGILTPFGLPGTVMPYSRARFSGYGQEFGVGTRWTPAETSSTDSLIPATFELEGLTRETRTGLSDLALVLRMSIPFGGEKAIEPRHSRNRAVNEAAMGPTVSTAYPETETTGAE